MHYSSISSAKFSFLHLANKANWRRRCCYQKTHFFLSFSHTRADGQSFGGDDTNLSGCLHRIIDLEESDKETINLLVFLLMQFLSRADQAFPSEEKPMAKMQSIVLKHLNLLLGYSQVEKSFHVTPNRMRCNENQKKDFPSSMPFIYRSSAVFNVFVANLPQVLDQNHLMGWCLLNAAFQVLLYAPNPNSSCSSENIHNIATHNYCYSLWYLEPHVRRNWLMSVLVILYKVMHGRQKLLWAGCTYVYTSWTYIYTWITCLCFVQIFLRRLVFTCFVEVRHVRHTLI